MNRHFLTGILVTLLMVVFVQPGLTQDQLGIFFDEAGTTSTITTSAAYSPVSAWVQLVAPSSSEAINGYEFRVEVHSDGPDPILAWQLPAQALNAATAPVFVVGMGTPLPIMPRITLAEVMIVVPEAGQTVWLSVHPLEEPSFFDPPGYGYPVCSPVYTYGSDSSYTPMQPVTQCDSAPVAAINPNGEPPLIVVSEFPEVITIPADKNSTTSGSLVLTNHGPISYSGTASIIGSSAMQMQMRINGHYFVSGPLDFQIPVGGNVIITPYVDSVDFVDAELQLDFCGEVYEITIISEDHLYNCAWGTDILAFGEVSAGPDHYLDVELTNTGYEGFALPYSIPVQPFYLARQGESSYLEIGESCTYRARFQSWVEGDYARTVDFNGLCTLLLTATSVLGPPECLVSVSSLDFTDFYMGENRASKYFTIRNIGGGLLEGSVVLDDTTGVFTLDESWGADYSLGSMNAQGFRVYFDPSEAGTYSATLDPGSNCGVLPLSGVAVDVAPECTINSYYLIDGVMTLRPIPVGGYRASHFRISNTGGGLLEGEATIEDPAGLFQLQYDTDYSLPHNRSHYISIKYTPVSVGLDTAVVHLSSECGDLIVVGEGLESYADCYASMYSYRNFERVAVGDTAYSSFYVRNSGYMELHGDIDVSEGDFEAEEPGPFSLPVGQYHWQQLMFIPQTTGDHFAMVTTGLDSCPGDWDVSGFAVPAGSDRMGFYADQEGLVNHMETTIPKVRETVYLVLKKPSSAGELTSWSSYYWSSGSAVVMDDWSTSLPGEIDGYSYSKHFSADSPVPFSDAMVLAQFSVLILDPNESSKLDLNYANYYSNENGSTRVGVSHLTDLYLNQGKSSMPNPQPTPMAQQVNDTVLVEWLRECTDFEGFNLYRRVDGSPVEKLNDEPINGFEGLVQYEDTTLAADWSVAYYSVTSLKRGKEGLPSEEVTLEKAVPEEENSIPARSGLDSEN